MHDTLDTLRNAVLVEFDFSCKRNPRYSLRALSRDIGLSPSTLCGWLRRKHGLNRVNRAILENWLSKRSAHSGFQTAALPTSFIVPASAVSQIIKTIQAIGQTCAANQDSPRCVTLLVSNIVSGS